MLSRSIRFVGIVTTATAPKISRPPIVGVPALTLCEEGPSSEIALPSRWARIQCTKGRPASRATAKAAAPVSSACVTLRLPSAIAWPASPASSVSSSSTTVSRASAREPFTSSASPGRSAARNASAASAFAPSCRTSGRPASRAPRAMVAASSPTV